MLLLGVPPYSDAPAPRLVEKAKQLRVVWPARLAIIMSRTNAAIEHDFRFAGRVLKDKPCEDLFLVLKVGPVRSESVAGLNYSYEGRGLTVGDVKCLECRDTIGAQI